MSDQISTLDGTQSEAPVTPAPASHARKSTAAAKLLQAAALAAVLVPLGSVAVETTNCHFYASGTGTSNCSTGPEGGLLFTFADPNYQAELRFLNSDGSENIFGDFNVEIIDTPNAYGDIKPRFNDFFSGFEPVPIGSDPLAPFIVFSVNAPEPCTGDCAGADGTWRSEGPRGPGAASGYNLWIYWGINASTPLFPSPSMLHDTGASAGDQDGQFDIDITRSYIECGPLDFCELALDLDPAAGGRDDMFQDFTMGDDNGVAVGAVPEPATLALLGTGVSALLYRRRRRRANAEAPTQSL
jgi:PEP-CTERM motif